ncbi:hypothetical protein DFH05DRAFT_1489625 [Lentinula detonsa]|uniref:Uncharacterized protein n=1 Tax=Lentinula detonsa TaxID=2804962 RepID=A0A9W8P3A8_9AGAR|nr:hypothetical protein DFH05DRAFT_1489625 [Lentinula detonsa]
MHLLSSPAHLFSMVLLSVVLGVMTMAVPLTVRNTDIGKSHWHSKRNENPTYTVSLVRRIGQEQPPSLDDRRSAVTTLRLCVQEHWYLYIASNHGFYAVQEGPVWQIKKIQGGKRANPGLIFGIIRFKEIDVDAAVRKKLLNDLLSKIEKITGPGQFEALNAVMTFLEANKLEGLEYKPSTGNPDAWEKIFLAMTDYDKYLSVFPNVSPKDRYKRPWDGTAPPAELITKGNSKKRKGESEGEPEGEQKAKSTKKSKAKSEGNPQLPDTSGGHSFDGQSGKQQPEGVSVEGNSQLPDTSGGQSGKTQGTRVEDRMKISNVLSSQGDDEK